MIYTKRLDSKELPLLYSLSDINECADPSLNDCDPNAKCYNLEGTFECRCKRGYRGDGKICECECCQIFHKVYGINTPPHPKKKQPKKLKNTYIIIYYIIIRILVLKRLDYKYE